MIFYSLKGKREHKDLDSILEIIEGLGFELEETELEDDLSLMIDDYVVFFCEKNCEGAVMFIRDNSDAQALVELLEGRVFGACQRCKKAFLENDLVENGDDLVCYSCDREITQAEKEREDYLTELNEYYMKERGIF